MITGVTQITQTLSRNRIIEFFFIFFITGISEINNKLSQKYFRDYLQWKLGHVKMDGSSRLLLPVDLTVTVSSRLCYAFCPDKAVIDEWTIVVVEVLLYVHRNRGLIRDGSPGRPPRLSHSSWAPIGDKNQIAYLTTVSGNHTAYWLPLRGFRSRCRLWLGL